MAYRCTARSAKKMVDVYTSEIERHMKRIRKDFNDMDFENASAKLEMDIVIREIESNCRNLINDINSYTFY